MSATFLGSRCHFFKQSPPLVLLLVVLVLLLVVLVLLVLLVLVSLVSPPHDTQRSHKRRRLFHCSPGIG